MSHRSRGNARCAEEPSIPAAELLQHEQALSRVVLDVRDVSPLQLSGLWRRFPVLDSADDAGVAPAPEGDAS